MSRAEDPACTRLQKYGLLIGVRRSVRGRIEAAAFLLDKASRSRDTCIDLCNPLHKLALRLPPRSPQGTTLRAWHGGKCTFIRKLLPKMPDTPPKREATLTKLTNSNTPAERRPLTVARHAKHPCALAWTTALFAACMVLGSLLPFSSAAQAPSIGHLQLGANVNERFQWLLPPLLDQTQTTWVRGFIPASEFIDGKRSYDSDSGLRALKAAADSGHKIILSIKWDCAGRGDAGPVPKPGSKEEQKWFQFADNLLAATAGKVSILVVDNELFIDTRKPDLVPGPDGQIPMIRFLKRLVDHISASHPKASDGGPLPIYAGGFTRLDFPKMQHDPATQQMIQWINTDRQISGADFHLHQPDMQTTLQALAFIHKQIPAKPLMVSEFSLIWKWKKHLSDPIGATDAGMSFAKKYGLLAQMTVAEYCNRAFAQKVTEQEWHDFLQSQPWFVPNYLDQIAPMMQSHGVTIATYALTLDPLRHTRRVMPDITAQTVPWFLNQLLLPGLAYVPGSDRTATNDGLYDSYVAWQKSHGEHAVQPGP